MMNDRSIPKETDGAPARIQFDGARRDFRKLVTRGAFLELITLGFYRFWLSTDMRRHLWSHTFLGGDATEYTGTAKELLIGFLFALAILMPIYIAYFLLGLEAERLQAFASIPLFILYYLFAQFAIFRARRYRLTRTIWRGVRAWMSGSGISYAFRTLGWDILTVMTLGIGLPWRQAALERYKMRHTRYGELQGAFVATGGELFRRAWWLWLLTWPSIVLVVPLPFIYAIYKAIEWRWWIGGLRVGEVAFSSDLDLADLLGLYWKMIGWVALLFVLLAGWFGAVIGLGAAIVGGGTSDQQMAIVMQHPLVLIAMALGYIALALVLGIVIRLYLFRDMWAKVVASTSVTNLQAADNVTAQGELASALGEGFADSLDVGGF